MGLWSPRGTEAFLLRKQLECQHVAIFNNITPEFARSMAGRSVAERARAAAFFGAAALLISGQMAGASADPEQIREAKEAVPQALVLANTGVSEKNVETLLGIADGAIVGTSLKENGFIWNPVDPERVRRLMARVREIREDQNADTASTQFGPAKEG